MNTQTPPTIPVGLATKLGVLTAALSAMFAAGAALAHGDHQPETIAGLIAAAVTVYGVVRGRSDQAAAALASSGTTLPLAPVITSTHFYESAGTTDVPFEDAGEETAGPEPKIPAADLKGRQGCAPLGHGADLSGGDAA